MVLARTIDSEIPGGSSTPGRRALGLSALADFIRSDNSLDPLVRVFVAHYQIEANTPRQLISPTAV